MNRCCDKWRLQQILPSVSAYRARQTAHLAGSSGPSPSLTPYRPCHFCQCSHARPKSIGAVPILSMAQSCMCSHSALYVLWMARLNAAGQKGLGNSATCTTWPAHACTSVTLRLWPGALAIITQARSLMVIGQDHYDAMSPVKRMPVPPAERDAGIHGI